MKRSEKVKEFPSINNIIQVGHIVYFRYTVSDRNKIQYPTTVSHNIETVMLKKKVNT